MTIAIPSNIPRVREKQEPLRPRREPGSYPYGKDSEVSPRASSWRAYLAGIGFSLCRLLADVFHGVARGHLEHRRIRFSPREIHDANRLRALSRVLPSHGHIHLKVRGIPEFLRGHQRLTVSDRSGANSNGFARPNDVEPIDHVSSKTLARKVALAIVESADRPRSK